MPEAVVISSVFHDEDRRDERARQKMRDSCSWRSSASPYLSPRRKIAISMSDRTGQTQDAGIRKIPVTIGHAAESRSRRCVQRPALAASSFTRPGKQGWDDGTAGAQPARCTLHAPCNADAMPYGLDARSLCGNLMMKRETVCTWCKVRYHIHLLHEGEGAAAITSAFRMRMMMLIIQGWSVCARSGATHPAQMQHQRAGIARSRA